MKKYLIIVSLIFILFLAMITVLTERKSEKSGGVDLGNYTVAVNEIEHLITDNDTETALIKAAELKKDISEQPSETDTSKYLWILFIASSGLIISIFIYIWLAILRPFRKLDQFAERIAAGDFDVPLDYERKNYFGKFTWAFDSMRREISTARACEKEAIENNKTVIASLSHDIKTPVASIRAYAEALEAGMDSNPKKRAKYVSVIMKKCDELATLTNDMLMHSISDLNKLKMNPSEFELCAFIKETVSEISYRNDIKLDLPPYFIDVKADINRFVQVFENLISNVSKYAKTKIEISALKKEDRVEIKFRDFGNGIPEEEIPFIFEKFYRGNRAGNENGAGLGLYIVKYIVNQSGGEIFAENLADGFQIKIVLPCLTS